MTCLVNAINIDVLEQLIVTSNDYYMYTECTKIVDRLFNNSIKPRVINKLIKHYKERSTIFFYIWYNNFRYIHYFFKKPIYINNDVHEYCDTINEKSTPESLIIIKKIILLVDERLTKQLVDNIYKKLPIYKYISR